MMKGSVSDGTKSAWRCMGSTEAGGIDSTLRTAVRTRAQQGAMWLF